MKLYNDLRQSRKAVRRNSLIDQLCSTKSYAPDSLTNVGDINRLPALKRNFCCVEGFIYFIFSGFDKLMPLKFRTAKAIQL